MLGYDSLVDRNVIGECVVEIWWTRKVVEILFLQWPVVFVVVGCDFGGWLWLCFFFLFSFLFFLAVGCGCHDGACGLWWWWVVGATMVVMAGGVEVVVVEEVVAIGFCVFF